MTGDEYKAIIDGFDVENNSSYQKWFNGTVWITYCNIFAQDVAAACETPLPTGVCQNMLDSLYGNNFPQWYSISFTGAQSHANDGFPTIAITYDHVAIVRPNDGTVPSEVKYVRITQAGNTLLNDSTIAYGWPADRYSEIKFYSWYD